LRANDRIFLFPNPGGKPKLESIIQEAEIMDSRNSDKAFAGSIPQIYESYLVPLIFELYAADLAARLSLRHLQRVLEVAAGTGAVTRDLAAVLPDDVSIVATDLNQAMLDQAASRPMARSVVWQQADAMALPFEDESFDAVVCQFGAMFFPDKAGAYAEAYRVLRPGGLFLFNVWDRLEENEFAETITVALGRLFPADPPQFLARTPHGYSDPEVIRRDVTSGGFTKPAAVTTVTAHSRAASCEHPAIAYCQGTPLRSEIETHGATRLEEATACAAEAIAQRFGRENLEGRIQAHVVTVEK
jgi:ubiquinone/menaquinone biosynthesis C-methylase UbiE